MIGGKLFKVEFEMLSWRATIGPQSCELFPAWKSVTV
jgi:hypothetical protein